MADENILSPMELDAIGEVMNISMGSAATAVSTMLDKQVIITTPNVTVEKMGTASYEELEPAMIVKIIYIKGVSGSNVMAFKQSDMQLILNQLMGIDEPPDENFVFDELSMSAACEVMNQMMGASATALSDFLGKRIDISPPTATIMDDEHTFMGALGIAPDETIVSTKFKLDIVGITQSEFVSIMTVDLAKEIVSQFMGGSDEVSVQPVEISRSDPPQGVSVPENTLPVQPIYAPPPQPSPPPQNVQPAQFPTFAQAEPADVSSGNISLLMNVPLTITVEIGKTKRKIKEIMDFAQGTVLELEKQAGAPVDIVVNGQLLARGDVVVIDDNFGVRITEIVNVKDLVNSINNKN